MNREQLIYELTSYEILYLLNNDDAHTIYEVAEFFANGGYTSWSMEDLQKKYSLFIAEEA